MDSAPKNYLITTVRRNSTKVMFRSVILIRRQSERYIIMSFVFIAVISQQIEITFSSRETMSSMIPLLQLLRGANFHEKINSDYF